MADRTNANRRERASPELFFPPNIHLHALSQITRPRLSSKMTLGNVARSSRWKSGGRRERKTLLRGAILLPPLPLTPMKRHPLALGKALSVLFLISTHARSCTLQLEDDMINGVFSDDSERQLDATTKFRKLLSKEKNPPIEKVIECRVVPRFVQFLREGHSMLQVRTPPSHLTSPVAY